METGLRQKTVLVTGGSGGIGQAIVRTMIAEHANVVVHYHNNSSQANALVASFGEGRSVSIGGDLGIEQDVVELFDRSEAQLGAIDILIANAGKWPEQDLPIHEMPIDRWHETLSVNLTSVFLCVREHMRRCVARGLQDPVVVITGSTAGKFGEAGHADYATAKSGFMGGLIQSLKNEITRVAKLGRVNGVCPGWTMTPMARSLAADEEGMKRALQTIALRKFASAEDIANAVVFLASNRVAGHITGQILFVDGGMEGRVINEPGDIDLHQAIPK